MKLLSYFCCFLVLLTSKSYAMEESEDSVPLIEKNNIEYLEYPRLKKAKNCEWLEVLYYKVISQESRNLIKSLKNEPENYPSLVINSQQSKRLGQITAHIIAAELEMPCVNLKPEHFTTYIQIVEIDTKIKHWLESHKKIAFLFSNLSSVEQKQLFTTDAFTNLFETISANGLVIICDQTPNLLPRSLHSRLVHSRVLSVGSNAKETNLRTIFDLCKELTITDIGEKNSEEGLTCLYYEDQHKCKGYEVIKLYYGVHLYDRLLQFLLQLKLSKFDKRLFEPQRTFVGYIPKHKRTIYYLFTNKICEQCKWHMHIQNFTYLNNFLDLNLLEQRIKEQEQKDAVRNRPQLIEESPEVEYISDDEEFDDISKNWRDKLKELFAC